MLKDCDGTPDAIIIATGSEVALAVAAAEQLTAQHIRVVSMPSTDRFEAQDHAYRESVLPCDVGARVAVEAGVGDGWMKYVGREGAVVSIDRFGESAPADDVFEYLGMTAARVIAAVEKVLSSSSIN